jgi:hypothetical protein
MSYQAPPPPPDGGYGQQPGYGYGAVPQKTSVLAIISLVTGILGIVPCCTVFVFGIAATVTGYLARNEIATSQGAKKGAGLAKAGLILGIIGIVLSIAYWILVTTTNSFEFNLDTNS